MKTFYFHYKGQRVTFGINYYKSRGQNHITIDSAKISFDGNWHALHGVIGKEIESKLIEAFHTNYTETLHFNALAIKPIYDSESSHDRQIVWSNNRLTMTEQNGVTEFAVSSSVVSNLDYDRFMFYASVLTFIESNLDTDITFDPDQLALYKEIKELYLLKENFSSVSQLKYSTFGFSTQGAGLKAVLAKRKAAADDIKLEIKTEVNNVIRVYENSGRKFHLFEQSRDRVDAINALVDDITLIMNIDTSTIKLREVKVATAVALKKAIVRTERSNADKLGFAFFGITKSRLAVLLTQYLENVMASAGLANDELNQLLLADVAQPVKYAFVR